MSFEFLVFHNFLLLRRHRIQIGGVSLLPIAIHNPDLL